MIRNGRGSTKLEAAPFTDAFNLGNLTLLSCHAQGVSGTED
jgi:hypothetical protein